MKLHVSPELALPLDWMTLATVVYGARGSGKTTLGSVIAEEVTKARQRFCAVDLKGDWYGLKSTADGKGDGIPVVVFGGDHQDVPLEEDAGAFVGETIAGLAQPAILDLEYLSKGKQVRFLAAFFEALYDRNRDPLLLLLDEAQRYAPQKPFDPDAAKCLGMVEDIVKLGRKHGIGPVLFTQRGSGLNKEVSELCDLLVAFRTPGPLDQDRVRDWLDANTTKAQRDEVMGQLAGLATGTAIFASGHPDLKVFGVYPVRRRETFDSSATPKVGHRRKEPKRLAKPDLEALRGRMAAAIERRKADDPLALRARIRELEAAAKKPAPVVIVPEKRVEVPILTRGQLKILTHGIAKYEAATKRLLNLQGILGDAVGRSSTAATIIASELAKIANTPAPSSVGPHGRTAGSNDGAGVRAAAPAAHPDRPSTAPAVKSSGTPTVRHREPRGTTNGNGDAKVPAASLRLLSVVAALEDASIAVTRTSVGAWVGIVGSGGYFDNLTRPLRAAGLLEGLRTTDAGRAAIVPAILDRATVRGYLSGQSLRAFDLIVEAEPHGLTRAQIGEQLGIDASGGYFDNVMRPLRQRGLVEGRPFRLAEALR